ncbi:MAG TPA: CCA tRNA nucleotidyltransferase [Candidatus Binataceae bacterium]|nr:CCA tRNA nucleotidyltransferase [Candidatus Binataceae bacterium]
MDHAREKQALSIIDRLRRGGFAGYFAGGCVRDRILGVAAKDYDIATDARPEVVEGLFDNTVAVGSRFGVIVVVIGDDHFEVATFRADAEYHDGRRPSAVRFGTLEEDARRRDFTIGGMYYDPAADRVIDLVGGRRDLRRGVIRAIGNPAERFEEDHLRILRAVRFAARLDFAIATETWDAMRQHAPSVERIAAERIGDELVRIMTEGDAARGLDLLVESGLAAVVLPEVLPLADCPQPPNFHPEGDVYRHTRLMLSMLEAGCAETLSFAALLHDITKPQCLAVAADGKMTYYGHTEQGAEVAREILRRLKRPRAVQERVAYLVRDHLRMCMAPRMRPATLKRMLAEDGFDELLELSRLDTLASSSNLGFYHFCRNARARMSVEEIRPRPLIGGDDLIALGLIPGPDFKQILRQVEDLHLDGALTTPEEALRFVREHHAPRSDAER